MAGYREIESEAEFDDALEEAGDSLVIADFWATWCGPCKMIGPYFEKLAADDKYSSVIFLKIDVDEVGEIAENYGITVMPTFLFFKNGEKVEEMSGANRDKLIEMLEKHMK